MTILFFEHHNHIRSYYKYKSIWDTPIGKVVDYSCEPDNLHNDNVVSVVHMHREVIISRHLSRGFNYHFLARVVLIRREIFYNKDRKSCANEYWL